MPPLILPQMEVHQTPGKETQWAFAGLLHHQNCSAITKVLMPSLQNPKWSICLYYPSYFLTWFTTSLSLLQPSEALPTGFSSLTAFSTSLATLKIQYSFALSTAFLILQCSCLNTVLAPTKSKPSILYHVLHSLHQSKVSTCPHYLQTILVAFFPMTKRLFSSQHNRTLQFLSIIFIICIDQTCMGNHIEHNIISSKQFASASLLLVSASL